ncbi:MAG: calcium-binding protein [Cellvibrionales bacterium]|nr:calcium-binding protein [Cellvibrionales bacterium]
MILMKGFKPPTAILPFICFGGGLIMFARLCLLLLALGGGLVVAADSGTGESDRLTGDGQDDVLKGRAGNDRLAGGAGQDELYGNRGRDHLKGGIDADALYGGAGDDRLRGGGGEDALHGGAGDDFLSGGGGDDLLAGGPGDDRLRGSKGNDRLIGDAGDDSLHGGAGRDILTGGAGADRFLLLSPAANPTEADFITDFAPAEDRLVVGHRVAELWFKSRQKGKGESEGWTRIYADRERTQVLAVLAGVFDLRDYYGARTRSGVAVPVRGLEMSWPERVRAGESIGELLQAGASVGEMVMAGVSIDDLRKTAVPMAALRPANRDRLLRAAQSINAPTVALSTAPAVAMEIQAALREQASANAPSCVLSPFAEVTRCTIALPEVVYDDSIYPADMADQSENYLVRIDSSRVFDSGDGLEYEITAGNPQTQVRHVIRPNNRKAFRNLAGYRITGDGKLYPRHVYLLSRNKDQLQSQAALEFFDLRIWNFRQYGFENHRLNLEHCTAGSYRADDDSLVEAQDCSSKLYWPAEYTHLKTDTDELTIRVTQPSTGAQKTVLLTVLPNHRAYPEPSDLSKLYSTNTKQIAPASSRGLACFAADGTKVDDCTAQLPLVARRHSPLLIGRSPDQTEKYLLRVDAKRAFRRTDNLAYEIISGNPFFLFPYYGPPGSPLHDIASPKRTSFYRLEAYQIDRRGRIHIKDAWLLGRNNHVYEHDVDQLYQTVRATARFGSDYGEEGACRRLYNSPDQDCSGLYFHHPVAYTFGRTETDTLVVRVTNKTSGAVRDITVTIEPHPRALASVTDCAHETDPLERWACINSQPLIPKRDLITTDEMREALPDDLTFPKSEYHLVNAVEFNSLDDLENMGWMPESFRNNPNVEIKDGKLRLHARPVPTGKEDGMCELDSHGWRRINSLGVFEPGAGYLEYRFTKYPRQRGHGGNLIHWSRYGYRRTGFYVDAPDRIFNYSNDTTVAGVAPVRRSRLSRRSIAKLGYIEVDFVEKWTLDHDNPGFHVFIYPRNTKQFRTYPLQPLGFSQNHPHPLVYEHPTRRTETNFIESHFRPRDFVYFRWREGKDNKDRDKYGSGIYFSNGVPTPDRYASGTFLSTYGMELLDPKDAPLTTTEQKVPITIRSFLNGRLHAMSDCTPSPHYRVCSGDFVNGAPALRLELIPGAIATRPAPCSLMKSTVFELDHIRYWQRRKPAE